MTVFNHLKSDSHSESKNVLYLNSTFLQFTLYPNEDISNSIIKTITFYIARSHIFLDFRLPLKSKLILSLMFSFDSCLVIKVEGLLSRFRVVSFIDEDWLVVLLVIFFWGVISLWWLWLEILWLRRGLDNTIGTVFIEFD